MQALEEKFVAQPTATAQIWQFVGQAVAAQSTHAMLIEAHEMPFAGCCHHPTCQKIHCVSTYKAIWARGPCTAVES